jgi:hypothetical protein
VFALQQQMAYFCTADFAGAYASDPDFEVHLVPAKAFVAMGKITKHEEVKSRGQLLTVPMKVLSSSPRWRNAIMFVSHRWVEGAPDSKDNAQFGYVCRLLHGLQGWESMYVWIDYSCMKQEVADLPTIRSLNIILAHCGMVAIVLPPTDPEGKEYSQRVWCVYEWLAALHFKPLLLVPTQSFANTLLRHTTAILKEICHPNAFVLLDQVRVASRGNHSVAADMLGTIISEDLFVKEAFVHRLQAFKDEDKAYVYENTKGIFSLLDVFFVLLVSKEFPLQTIAATDMHTPGGVGTFHDPRHPPSLLNPDTAADSDSSDSELDRQLAALRNDDDDD